MSHLAACCSELIGDTLQADPEHPVFGVALGEHVDVDVEPRVCKEFFRYCHRKRFACSMSCCMWSRAICSSEEGM